MTATKKDVFSFKQVWASASSPHVILNFFGFFFNGAMLYGLALYLPTIVSQFGHSRTHTQLLSVPPFAVGFLCMYFSLFVARIVVLMACNAYRHDVQLLSLGSLQNALSYDDS